MNCDQDQVYILTIRYRIIPEMVKYVYLWLTDKQLAFMLRPPTNIRIHLEPLNNSLKKLFYDKKLLNLNISELWANGYCSN